MSFLTDSNRTSPNFSTKIQALEARSQDLSISPKKQGDASRSAEALERVHAAYQKTGLGKLDLVPLPASRPKLDIQGVTISLTLGCQVRGQFKGNPAVGALTVLFNKSEASASARDERARTAAALSLIYATEHLGGHGKAVAKLCLAYDVFRGTVTTCPSQIARRIANMEATCEEVALRWPAVKVPDDYDGPPIV
ncbi:hypothetical protein [Ahrensia sp. R2A130]|uniref:hypothetical protein n=1 Tax=Ahrensia sp. R2A130 TaxID=744979 RepID=UPI0012EA0329|nr:hypothetical protein [Ahrensia sp. R2A130]